jgi:hypothetical protein
LTKKDSRYDRKRGNIEIISGENPDKDKREV